MGDRTASTPAATRLWGRFARCRKRSCQTCRVTDIDASSVGLALPPRPVPCPRQSVMQQEPVPNGEACPRNVAEDKVSVFHRAGTVPHPYPTDLEHLTQQRPGLAFVQFAFEFRLHVIEAER